MRAKTATDHFWNERAVHETDPAKVNMPDTVQRDLELTFVFKHLLPGSRLVEIGCGNGYVTRELRTRVAHVDAFDFSENMIARARETCGETNNRFFHDDLLAPQHLRGPYDIALCVRVLMNLRNLDEQKTGIVNIANMLRTSGRLILVEGFLDGFEENSRLRQAIGLTKVIPAKHNFYSHFADLLPVLEEHFLVEHKWHIGLYDFLTRVVCPSLVGAQNATEAGDFHKRIEPIVHAFDAPDLAHLARVQCFLFTRK